MTFFRSVSLSLTMFSRLPLPKGEFSRANGAVVLAALPLVGVVNVFLLFGWVRLASALGLGTVLTAAGLTLLPVALSGGIHLDGFADTVDALSSRASKARKVEILGDPNIGAFAGIGLAAYLLVYFALACELLRQSGWYVIDGLAADGSLVGAVDAAGGPAAFAIVFSVPEIWLLGFVSVMSRAAGAFASLAFPFVENNDLLHTFRGGRAAVSARVCCAVWFALAAGFSLVVSGAPAAFAILAVAFCALYVRFMSLREFGGMTGDLAGYLIQISELWALGAVVAVTAGAGKGTML
ncbi:MAG: adenosylcobinamide-GDP ribazoletransferase [Clostridiales Family XIII bacterium]|nr:adenosylcobinamide-GDP ribazoletransferase [Clostridiales Family XIII bacterium]